ncbi:hypothetical protein [Porphyromonas uenonis]|uniref:Polyketide cyclase/dehydrase n=1 Tax=Porphyromonas uenonis 60-3 TaxID=596327 RepID=C2MAN6_9PORP|nr:hypothetical protein [Porphyromonas uenonis]EEK17212.1 hypothetical protein PORUE0001_1114 [Porphyromonas uenonis 60-3]
MTIQSQPVASTYSCEAIYRKISDLTNLEELHQLLEEKQVKVSSLTSDRCEVQAQVMKFSADLALVVSERIPTEEVRYQIEHDMLPAKVSIRLTPQESEGSTLVVSMEAKLNPFIAGMVQPRLEEAVQYIANMLGQIRYDA